MRRWKGVSLVFLSMFVLAGTASAQDRGAAGSSERLESGFSLEQNYPNPFNPETTIPFTLGDDLFVAGRNPVVSIRIYNLLLQYVATPTALRHPAGDATPVLQLEYTEPGRHEAFWDGRDQNGREVASGVYFVELVVNGQSKHGRMFVAK